MCSMTELGMRVEERQKTVALKKTGREVQSRFRWQEASLPDSQDRWAVDSF